MSRMSDQQYLLRDQYRDASKLDARVQLHKRFSTSAYGWCLCVFDQLNLPRKSHILELGCGPGRPCVRRREGCKIYLVGQARESLGLHRLVCRY